MKPTRLTFRPKDGFTLIELLVVIGIIAILIAVLDGFFSYALTRGKIAASTSNIHELVQANISYAADNNGYYCPAQEPLNLTRWHGQRTSVSAPFDGSKGYLSPYLGSNGQVKVDPLFVGTVVLTGASSFEDGSGGYGYNEIYIGGTPANNFQPINSLLVRHPERTIMFTTTAFSKSDGVQEYPFSEAPQWVDPNYNMAGALQPSVHFRCNGRALVAWCDGSVTLEPPSQLGGQDYYGGNSQAQKIGYVGPQDNNGYWNPDYQPTASP